MESTQEHGLSLGSLTLNLVKGTALCDICRKIDFDALWCSKRLDDAERTSRCQQLGSELDIARRARNCGFCRWIHENILHLRGLSPSASSGGEVYSLTIYGSTIYNGMEHRRESTKGYLIPIVEMTCTDADGENLIELAHLRLVDLGRSDVDLTERKTFLDNKATTIRQCKFWLSDCLDHHTDHAHVSRVSDLRGLRLINVATREVISAPPDAPYLALSYVWGANAPRYHIVGNHLEDHLPQTIEDACTLTLGLGYKYLWIDAICIPQDEEVVKMQQIRAMDAIYESAIATIIATGPNVDSGLPLLSRDSNQYRSLQIGQRLIEFQPLPWTHLMATHGQTDPEFSPWSTRGWTFQEVMISRRKLIFTDSRVIFECDVNARQAHPTDCHEQINVNIFNDMKVIRSEAMEDWNMHWYQCLLNKYLKRTLSYDNDIVMAFYGISRLITAVVVESGGPCLAIPTKSFLSALMWAPPPNAMSGSEPRTIDLSMESSHMYRPSWHWSSIKLPQGIAFVQGSEPSQLYRRANDDFTSKWTDMSWDRCDFTGVIPFEGRITSFENNGGNGSSSFTAMLSPSAQQTVIENSSAKGEPPEYEPPDYEPPYYEPPDYKPPLTPRLTPRLNAAPIWKKRQGTFLTCHAWLFASSNHDVNEPNPAFAYAKSFGGPPSMEANKQFILLVREETDEETELRKELTWSLGRRETYRYNWSGRTRKTDSRAWRREGWAIVDTDEWEAERPRDCEILLA